MANISEVASSLLRWCVVATLLCGCISTFFVAGTTAASVPNDKDSGTNIAGHLSDFKDAAQSAYTAALAEAADVYSKAMSAVALNTANEPEPVQKKAFASVSSAYFDAISAAQQAVQKAKTNIIAESTPTPTTGYFDWVDVQSLAQKNLDDSIKWASAQYEQAKLLIGATEPTPTAPSEKAESLLEQAKLNYYAGLGIAHDRYSEFITSARAAASSWTGATPTAQPSANLAEQAKENWDRLIAQVSTKVYGAPTPTPAWYAHYYSQATNAPVAVQSLVSELLVDKEPAYRNSVLEKLAAAYSEATSTAGSVYTEATQAVDDVIEGAAEALGSAGKVVLEKINDLGDRLGETIGESKDWIKDEL
ncbi:hypothetical protein BX600DRAFT_461324 [Xylariales sp. PMI_506]|nr:hypothetical protein BX600DRAFT_461324 [Xylariales sp. PMI_506]